MDKYAFSLLLLLVFLLSGGLHSVRLVCNETLMLQRLPLCGEEFEDLMKRLDTKKWCNLTEFIMFYDSFSNCTEFEANNVGCFWPNPLAEGFITSIHKQFFSNCTSERIVWEDPPDEILITLILIPVFLTAGMISLVVWCSKRSDILV
ncbi:receptor activity-modifying protein 3 isoform X2 [Rhinatrema bivittatum]|uniref:receptor activity-modifying protein 3 isoform X2 n=1 Tax=Rhinatrema bivittatum TaxID=194408 RepID=UPI00112A94EC|nr:receptor activity-modifying protein 3 isoform X2 [Rhinatrema bivittatum]